METTLNAAHYNRFSPYPLSGAALIHCLCSQSTVYGLAMVRVVESGLLNEQAHADLTTNPDERTLRPTSLS